jgi:hypothetical protein
MDFIGARNGAGGASRQQFRQPRGQQRAENPAGRGQHQALGEELADHAHPARPERRADGDLALPRGAAREQQVGDIGTGDQQNEAHRAEHHEHRRLRVADDFLAERHERGAREMRQAVLRGNRDARDLGDRLFPRDAGCKPRVDVERMVRGPERLRIQRHRHDQIGPAHEPKRRRQDAEDGGGAPFDADDPSHHVGRPGESLLPDLRADQDDVAVAGLLRLTREDASGGRRHAEEREKLRRHANRAEPHRAAPLLDGERQPRIVDDCRIPEHPAVARPVQILPRRHDRLLEPGLRPRLAHRHHPVGLRVGERPQQHGIGRREHRRRRADAEGEDEDGGDREAAAVQQHPDGKTKVSDHDCSKDRRLRTPSRTMTVIANLLPRVVRS